jgi:hypothetical protein
MSFIDQGFSKYLSKGQKEEQFPQQLDPTQVDQLISEISGTKITNYTSTNFNFIPTTPNANPKQGDVFYDKTAQKLNVFNGSAYEVVVSAT